MGQRAAQVHRGRGGPGPGEEDAGEPAAPAADVGTRPEPGAAPPRALLIVNADDFGASHSVNAGVLRAHRQGLLTSASLMVTGRAFEEAVALARGAPGLAVGLHLVLVQGRAAAARERVPHLVDEHGCLPRDPVSFGVRLAYDRGLQREVAIEIEAQVARFLATGLPLSHVDGHLNFHLHPAVFTPLVRVAAGHGAHGVRLPRDDLGLAFRHGRRRLPAKLFQAAAFGLLSAWAQRRLPPGVRAPERVYGLFQSGGLTPEYVRDVLARLRRGSAELYAHPATEAGSEALGPNVTDLATLCDPAVAAALQQAAVCLGHYASLETA